MSGIDTPSNCEQTENPLDIQQDAKTAELISQDAKIAPNNSIISEGQDSELGNEEELNLTSDEQRSSIVYPHHNSDYDENVYEQNFQISQFLTAFIIASCYQLFSFTSIPVLAMIFGKTLLKNMHFWPRSIIFVAETFVSSYTLFVWVMYFEYNDVFMDFLGTIIATQVALSLRMFIISWKYGMMAGKRFQRYKRQILSFEEFNKDLLLPSWVKIPDETMLQEIEFADKQDSSSSNEVLQLRFLDELPIELQNLAQVCPYSQFVQEANAKRDIPTQTFARIVISQIWGPQTLNSALVQVIIGLIFANVSIIVRAYIGGYENSNEDAFTVTFTIVSILISWFTGAVYIAFNVVGIIDFKRKVRMMQQCSSLISDIDAGESVISEKLAKINMWDGECIMAWYKLRRFFLNFGNRYTKRIMLYVSMNLVFWLFIVIVILLQLIGILPHEYNFYIVSLLFLGAVILSIIVYISICAVKLNDYFEIHKDLLFNHLDTILRKIQLGQSSPGLLQAKSAINQVLRKLDQDIAIRPIQIVGIRMDQQFVVGLSASLISGAGAILALYLGVDI